MNHIEEYKNGINKHIVEIKKFCKPVRKLKVVVDCGCGAAYGITPVLLGQLGCEVIPLNCYPNGIFPRDIEPIEANLSGLKQAVRDNGADLGIAHDGDADRMMAVDEKGRFISGDKMLAIFAQSCGSKEIVTTINTSMFIEEMGFNVVRTKVGDPYVSEELKKGRKFGGETSGAWVFPQITLCPDGIFAAGKVTEIAAAKKLSILADEIKMYPVLRGSVSGTQESMPLIKETLIKVFAPKSIDTIDGLKLNLEQGWILVRPSGTEPKIRITVEAKDDRLTKELYDTGERLIKESVQVRHS
jgi:phosphoglucosamine mutase